MKIGLVVSNLVVLFSSSNVFGGGPSLCFQKEVSIYRYLHGPIEERVEKIRETSSKIEELLKGEITEMTKNQIISLNQQISTLTPEPGFFSNLHQDIQDLAQVCSFSQK